MKVTVGIVHGEEVDGWFFHSMLHLVQYARLHEDELHIEDIICIRSGPALAMGRGHLVKAFLDTTGDALLMVDADMQFEPGDIASMVNAFERMRSTYDNVGILGGLAFMTPGARADRPVPTLWKKHPDPPHHMVQFIDYPENQLLEVDGTGGACVLIGRDVLEKVAATQNPFHHINLVDWHMLARSLRDMDLADATKVGAHIEQINADSDQLGEDLSFCHRVREAGFRIFVHTGLHFEHSKSLLVGEVEYKRARAQVAQVAQEAK